MLHKMSMRGANVRRRGRGSRLGHTRTPDKLEQPAMPQTLHPDLRDNNSRSPIQWFVGVVLFGAILAALGSTYSFTVKSMFIISTFLFAFIATKLSSFTMKRRASLSKPKKVPAPVVSKTNLEVVAPPQNQENESWRRDLTNVNVQRMIEREKRRRELAVPKSGKAGRKPKTHDKVVGTRTVSLSDVNRKNIELTLKLRDAAEATYARRMISHNMPRWADEMRAFVSENILQWIVVQGMECENRASMAKDEFLASQMQTRYPADLVQKLKNAVMPLDIFACFENLMLVGHLGDQLAQLLTAWRSVLTIIESSGPETSVRTYTMMRIIELAKTPFISGYKWKSGSPGPQIKWTRYLPCDATLVVRSFCAFLKVTSNLDALRNHFITFDESQEMFGEVRDQGRYFGQSKPLPDVHVIAFVEYQRFPPHYCLAIDRSELDQKPGTRATSSDWVLWQTIPGEDNVFHTIALFVYILQSRRNSQLMTCNLNALGLRVRLD